MGMPETAFTLFPFRVIEKRELGLKRLGSPGSRGTMRCWLPKSMLSNLSQEETFRLLPLDPKHTRGALREP